MPISVILEVVYRAEDNLEGSINSIIKTVHPLYLIYICCSCAISGIGYNQQNSDISYHIFIFSRFTIISIFFARTNLIHHSLLLFRGCCHKSYILRSCSYRSFLFDRLAAYNSDPVPDISQSWLETS
jgi:hypothetical protein